VYEKAGGEEMAKSDYEGESDEEEEEEEEESDFSPDEDSDDDFTPASKKKKAAAPAKKAKSPAPKVSFTPSPFQSQYGSIIQAVTVSSIQLYRHHTGNATTWSQRADA
jgi:hypothetical protein